MSYGTYDEELRVIGGLWAGLGKGFSTTLIWDGVNLHPTLTYQYRQHVFNLLWAATENPGVAYSIKF